MRGRVTFSAAGRERALRYTMNALVELEERLGSEVMQGLLTGDENALARGGMFKTVRAVFAAGLRGAGDAAATEEVAGDIIDELTLTSASELMMQALQAAFPDGSGGQEQGKRRPAA